MKASRAEYVTRVIDLYVGAPDTADVPRDTDWLVAGAMYDAGISIDVVELAFQVAFLRRYLANLERDGYSPLIRSLAYFRAVIDSLTPAERDPTYMAYVASSYAAKRDKPAAHLRRIHEAAQQLREKTRNIR
jgi:hypothetical protein